MRNRLAIINIGGNDINPGIIIYLSLREIGGEIECYWEQEESLLTH